MIFSGITFIPIFVEIGQLVHTHCLHSILRVLENRVRRRIFGPKGKEVTGRKEHLHNEIVFLAK
jgi:hypothetical protein